MARTAVLAACLWLIIFTPFSQSSCGAAESPPILEKTLSISPWHIHLSQQRFAAGGVSNALLRVTKVGAEPRIKDGLITLNSQIILLHSFFRSSESVFEKPIQLKDGNLLIALLAGEPGARLKLEILANQPPDDSPLILTLDAEPEVIKKGRSSRLSWKTEHAEICEMEPGIGRVDVSGALFVSPSETTRYTLTATGKGDPASASVTVTVADSAPEAEPQHVTTAEDEETPITLSASDPDGDELSFRIETWPSHGTLSGEAPELIYRPDPHFHGSDGFSFTASDAEQRSEPARVAITVLSVNDPPVARPGPNRTVRVGETVVLDGSLSEDLDQDPLSFDWAFAAKPAGSSSVIQTPGSVKASFVPDKPGAYEIRLIVNDGTTDSAPAVVVVSAAPRMVTVPGVAGLRLAEAISALEAAALMVGLIAETPHDTLEAGRVIGQVPAAGAQAQEGSIVDLTVSLGRRKQPPTIAFSATPAGIEKGGSVVLSWSTANATSVHLDGGTGLVAGEGSTTVTPGHTTVYTLTATGADGTTSAQAAVEVTAPKIPQPEGSFGRTYEDLIPADASLAQHDPGRFAIITGRVEDLQGAPLADVSVTVHGRPDCGTARTGGQGRFSLPVEGGGVLTVVFRKAGLISVQRQVQTGWNDTAVVETIRMTPEDQTATSFTFDGSAGTVSVHRSAEVADESGARACTLVLTGDNQAYLADEAGNKSLTLKTVTVRATEYRTPETMPAVLPPTSAFTWCAELKVDGAERVRFEKPVVVWVDNFLGFPVGEIVPVGYYDRDRAQWKPMPNGVVVRLLDTDADGAVDALDADGDNQPDDLDADGSLRNEVTGLDDAQRYAAGATFWRAAVTHFSPIDFNWPLVLPADSIAPNPPVLAHADQQQVPERDSRRYTCSYVEEKSRIFHEDIPIPGTEFTLHYSSSRVQGYKPGVFSIPVSGKVVPASLENIIVKLTVAGRQFEMVLPPQPEQTAQFEWDGLDHLGRVVDYPVKAYSRIGYVYSGVYARPARVGPAFGQTGAAPVPEMIPSRQPMIRWLDQEQTIVRGKGSLAEGWTLSAHHASSPSEPTILIKGDGTIGTNSVSLIQTVAGDGSLSHLFGGMGGPGTKAQIGWPVYLTTDAAGNVYILTGKLVPYSHWDFRILKLDSKGIIDQLPVTLLGYPPAGLATDGNSNFYFSLPSSGVVYKTGPGVYQRIAGTDNKGGYSGDGGLAVNALLNSPRGLAIDAQGNLYIADYGNHVIRQMDPNGVIITAAGNGKGGFGGDGGPATEAELKGPNDVAIDRQGNLFIVDQLNYRVRKVDSSGVMTTVAGNGTQNYSGNGVAATDTGFPSVDRIEIDSADNLYILSSYPGNHVWKVDATGTVTTVAGSGPMNWGQGAYAGDGGPATAARLNWPMGIAIDAAGNLFIADSDNHRVRRVSPVTARINNWTSESDITFTEEAVGHILSASGRHLRTIDLKSGVSLFEFGYDDNGLLVSISDRFGNDTLIERGPGGIPRAIVSPDGLRTELTIDARNHLTRISYPDGGVYRFEYTETGLATLKVQPSGNRLVHVYDATGRLSGFQDEEGGDWAFSSSMLKEGDVLHETLTAEGLSTTQVDRVHASGAYQSMLIDPAGAQSVVSESADGLATTVLQSCGNTAEHFYDLDPQFKYKYLKKRSVKTPSGLKRETTHERTYTDADEDSIPDLVTEKHKVNNRTAVRRQDVTAATQQLVSPEGRSVTLEYDPATLAAERVKVPGLLETSYTYDSRGRLTQAAVGTRTTSYSYSEKGFLAAVTDPQNRTTSFSHDAVGRVTAVVRPDLSRLEFAYDANGNLALLVNPSGVEHRFGHNRVNHRSSYTTPLSGSYIYKYDRDRRPTETVLPSGRVIRSVYDKGRLIRTETPEGSIYFDYLCGSKLGTAVRGAEGIAYGYDGSLLVTDTRSGTLGQAISYAYDPYFELIESSYAGMAVSYGYDDDGLLTQAGAFAVSRDPGNGLAFEVSDGRLTMSRSFNGYGEIATQSVAVAGKGIAGFSLARDNTGRVVQKSQAAGGVAAAHTYQYDAMGRLQKAMKDGTLVEEYAYDENGTRIYELNTLRGITGRSYQYSDEDHLLTAGEWGYQYDLDGFLTHKTHKTNPTDKTSYAYSAAGELLSVGLPDGRQITYVHEPLGRRIAKAVNGAIVEKYLWQGMTRLLAVFDGAGALRMRFEYADERMPSAMSAGASRYYLAYDQVGSLIAVADAAGGVVKRVEYDSFGNIISDSNPGVAVPFGFAGGLFDRDTGLLRFGYRDYDPEVGRWTAKDPIGFAGGDTDLYGYVLNDPVNLIDPWGFLAANWHFGITYVAARKSGMGLLDSIKLGWGAVAADFGTQGNEPGQTNLHAMAGRGQSPEEAIEATKSIISDPCGDIATKVHAAQDLATPGHSGKPWSGFHFDKETAKHLLGDFFPSQRTISQAIHNTNAVLGGK